MNSLKTWLVDVGFWYGSVEEWSWAPWNFRLRFWQTPTNSTHRTYRAVISRMTEVGEDYIQAAYRQGLKDGFLQYAEMKLRPTDEPPSEPMYMH